MGMSKQTIQTAPIREALVSPVIFKLGIGPVVITRILPDKNTAMGVFLLDVYCLGVKNAFFTLCPEFKYRNAIEKLAFPHGLDIVAPSYARKLVEDAVEYARGLGFEPHREYRDAAAILGDIDSKACPEKFTFGKDGKPLYVSGPEDSDSMIERVMATLRSRCGDDGFHYLIGYKC